MSTVEALELISGLVLFGSAVILLALGREDRAAAWPFAAMLAVSIAIMIVCQLVSTITKGA